MFLPVAAPLHQQGIFLLCAGGAGVAGLAAWALAGAALQRWLRQPARQAAFHRAMAATLAFTSLWGLRGAWAA